MTTSNAQDLVGGKNTQEKLPVNTYRTSRQDKNTAHKTSRTKRWTKRKKAPVFHFCADTGIASRGENKDHERRPFSPPPFIVRLLAWGVAVYVHLALFGSLQAR
jgi:hypothetical protein